MSRACRTVPIVSWLAGWAGLVLVVATLSSLPAPGPVQAQGIPGPVRYRVVTDGSEVRYRVREQLVSLSFPNDAVGATSAVDGGIALDAQGRVVPAESRITVDLRTLRSDEPRRDNYLRRNTLETERYPTVVLVPTEIRGLGTPLPATGSAVVELIGDLTIRDTTRRTSWQTTATFDGAEVRVRAATVFSFADFNLRVPRVSVVLSVVEQIRLEADLRLRRDA